ncbi:MAG: alpha-glucosidase, partial [Hymenobacter sp.]
VDADRKELDMAYHFEAVDYAKSPDGYDLVGLKKIFTRWDSSFATNGWLSIFLTNHDQARLVSRWGNDSPEFGAPSAKMLATFILSMRGTPYWYNGDELGMTNIRFNSIKDYRDVAAINEYAFEKNSGGDTVALLKKFQFGQRDNGRTPFQWNASANAGFTTGKPWLAVNPNYTTINEAIEDKDPQSILNYFRKMTALRNSTPALVYGKYTLLDANNPSIYAYTRELNGKKLLVLLNFKNETAAVNTGLDMNGSKVLINNYNTARTNMLSLRPYEATIYELQTP